MASRTQWTWVWASSRSWWWTVKPGVLQSMGLQRVWHNWATELNFAYVESLLAVLECLKPCTCFNWIFNFLKCFYLFTHLGQVLVSTPRIASLHASMPTVLLRQMESSSWTKDQTRAPCSQPVDHLARLLCCKLLFPFPSSCFGSESWYLPHTGSEQIDLHLLGRGWNLRISLGFFSKEFISFPHLYLFLRPWSHIPMGSYRFILYFGL